MDLPFTLTSDPRGSDALASDIEDQARDDVAASEASWPNTMLGHDAVQRMRLLGELRDLEEAGAGGLGILAHALASPLRSRTAIVSSFGAESALLLAMAAEIDRHVPVIFLETGKHFPETLAHRDRVVARLGLTEVRNISATPAALAARDPGGELWQFDTDACCALRKVEPLEAALAEVSVWISGRKRFQAATRTQLPFVEDSQGRIKLNPLADWDATRILAELARRDLPRHPLVEQGYPSIGCAVCTRSVGEGEDSRAGRWSGSRKLECGIHQGARRA